MIELNKEYTYEDICIALDWKKATGYQKQRQIKTIEESYEFFHPISKKTKKEKKSYIFTKQIKEAILEDNRGGFRESSGRKALIPEDEFEFLWRVVVSRAYDLNSYFEREWLNKVYFSNTLLFSEFGFNYAGYLEKAKFEEDDKIVKYIFSDIVYDALKANTITRLCKRYGLKKNSLPKGILRSRSKNRMNQLISDDKLLTKYNEIEAEALKELKCKDVIECVRQGKYSNLVDYIQLYFECEGKFNVQRYNMIQVTDFSVIENGKRLGYQDMEQYKLLKSYRRHFREVIFSSVEKSCMRRIEDSHKYKIKLNEKQKELLKKYLYNMLGKEEVVPAIELEEYEWLDLVV